MDDNRRGKREGILCVTVELWQSCLMGLEAIYVLLDGSTYLENHGEYAAMVQVTEALLREPLLENRVTTSIHFPALSIYVNDERCQEFSSGAAARSKTFDLARFLRPNDHFTLTHTTNFLELSS